MTPEERKQNLRRVHKALLDRLFHLGGYVATTTPAAEADLLWQIIDGLVDQADASSNVLREFIADIEAVGILHVHETWPDLAVTYERAQEIILAEALSTRGRGKT